jgi:hypothetical protein
MKARFNKLLLPVVTIASLAGMTGMNLVSDRENQVKQYHYFEDPLDCSGCHWDRYERFSVSQHSKGFTGDFFQAQFYDLVLPSMKLDERLSDVHEGCIGCHSPSAFLSGDMIPDRTVSPDNHWKASRDAKTRADRGIFCDFCHTLDRFGHDSPFNHDYISHATAGVDPKRADLEFPWSPHHETQTSEIFEDPMICATCHNELNPYNVWVKATEMEYTESVYFRRGIVCQDCHMQPMSGKPAKMGLPRVENHDHWFGGGFAEFVEGAAGVYIQDIEASIERGETMEFSIMVKALATGHKFPTGSVEERDVWLHVSLQDIKGKEVLHIPVPENPDDPNDHFFITSNAPVAYPSHSTLSDPIARDGLTEGDRIYHSIFLDSDKQVTYAQWLCVEEIENRLDPLEERMEQFGLTLPEDLATGEYYLSAQLYYRRMPDPLAEFLGIEKRPVLEVSKDIRKLVIR